MRYGIKLLRLLAYIIKLRLAKRITPAVWDAVRFACKIVVKGNRVAYLAGPLTGVSDEVKARYASLSQMIGAIHGWFGYAPHLHGTDPVKHPTVTPAEVRDIDFLWAIVVADIHVNSLHPLAHGNGIEEGWAEMARVPVIYLAPAGMTLSRLVRGMRNIVHTIVYEEFETCLVDVQRCIVTHG